MKKVIIAILALVIFSVGLYSWKHSGSYEIKNVPIGEGPIVAFGDSLIQGVGATEGNDLVSLLSEKIEEPIINLGKSGDTTTDALLRVESVLELNPKIVIVLLGGNDYLKRIPKEKTFENLALLVKQIQDSGSAVLLLGVRGRILRDTYEGDYKNFARTYGTAYVSNILDELLGNKEFMYDSIHPNDKGYAIIADRVAPTLKELLEK